MFGLSKYALAGAGIALALALGWGFRVDNLRAGWKDKTETWATEAGVVTAVAASITENPDLEWKDVPTQLQLYGAANVKLLEATGEVTLAINAQGAERRRLLALNEDLRAQANKLIKERAKLLNRLSESALDAGDRENCQEQLGAVVRALNLVYEEGL